MQYVTVINEKTNRDIARVVTEIFNTSKGAVSLDKFRNDIRDKLNIRCNPVAVSQSQDPSELDSFAKQNSGCLYPLIDDVVYSHIARYYLTFLKI